MTAQLALPTRLPLNPVQLIEYARLYAEDVSGGRYPYVRFEAEQRWHQRLYRDGIVDIWLIGWLPTQGTQLHDHGGSSGAFAVVSGRLDEAIHAHGRGIGSLTERRRQAGDAVGFGAQYVHDVRNLSDQPAVSVHAYSPPLTSMNFYDLADGHTLRGVCTVATDDPEPELSPDLTPRVSEAGRPGAA